MRVLIATSAVVVAISAGVLANDRAVLVSDDLGGGAAVIKLVDINGDGDALDAGEHTLWADGLTSAGPMRLFDNGVLTVDPISAQLLRLSDLNSDGDALDVGESIVWSDGFSSPIGLDVSGTEVFVSDVDGLFRLIDLNGDGDALDVGERSQFGDVLSGAQSVLVRENDVLVGTNSGVVHQLIDLNGDGDALDGAEHLIYADAPAFGMVATDDGAFLSSGFVGSELLLIKDRNGDGDALDVLEVLPYADAITGINGPLAMVRSALGGVLLVENRDAEVTRIVDRNADGDALDVGEVILFGDGFTSPVGIVVIPEPRSMFLAMLGCLYLARMGRSRNTLSRRVS